MAAGKTRPDCEASDDPASWTLAARQWVTSKVCCESEPQRRPLASLRGLSEGDSLVVRARCVVGEGGLFSDWSAVSQVFKAVHSIRADDVAARQLTLHWV